MKLNLNRKERTMALAIGVNLFVILLKFGLARASGSLALICRHIRRLSFLPTLGYQFYALRPWSLSVIAWIGVGSLFSARSF